MKNIFYFLIIVRLIFSIISEKVMKNVTLTLALVILIPFCMISSVYAQQSQVTKMTEYIQDGDLNGVKSLLNKGFNPNSKTDMKDPVYYYALFSNNFEMIKLLTSHGADPKIRGEYGDGPLGTLIFYVADRLTDDDNDADTEISQASSIIKLLLQQGADPNERNSVAETVLMAAADAGMVDIAMLLIKSGADVNSQDISGMTALMKAVSEGYPELAAMLIQKGANLEAKEEEGETALMYAVIYGQTEIVELLLKAGANVNALSNDGVTAYDIFDSRSRYVSVNGVPIEKPLMIGVILEEYGAKYGMDIDE